MMQATSMRFRELDSFAARLGRMMKVLALGAVMLRATEGIAGAPADQQPSAAPPSLSAQSRQELSDLLAGQSAWTTISWFDNRLPRRPVDTFDRYLMWNEIALDTTAIDHTPLVPGDVRPTFGEQFGPPRSARAMAIVHIAMFEAVNAVVPRFKTYAGVPPATDTDLSPDLAIAQGAHDTLVALYPAQRVRLDALLAQDTAYAGGTTTQTTDGAALGAEAAAAILTLRANDGSQVPEISVGTGPGDYRLTSGPGYWSPDPVSGLQTALGANWGSVKPFVLPQGDQFRPAPPPALTSDTYAAAYQHTFALGGDPDHGTPTQRTWRETFISRFWGYDGTPALCAPPRLYNMVARSVALQQGLDNLPELARYLALVNVAMADAAIAAWDAKYYYQFWRPVIAIRNAAATGNPRTPADPAWYPLGAPATNTSGPNFTPPFPAYPSGHAAFGGALFEVLRGYWPDATPFTIVSDEWNGVNKDANGQVRPLLPESFASFTEAEQENAESRIYAGIHWEFDATSGNNIGHKVARWVIAHAFQRLGQAD